MALVVALTLLALQGAYTASLLEPSRHLQDLLTALPDKSQRSGVQREPLTLIIGKDVKRVFSRKGLPNKSAASRTIRPQDRHLDLETHLNDSHELHSPDPVLSLLDNVSLQEPDDTMLRNAVAQLIQEVEDRQAKKHRQQSNAKNNHNTSSVHEDSIKINNIADHTISPNLKVRVIQGSHDGKALSYVENDNRQGRVSLDNTTDVRNEVEERSDPRLSFNKNDDSNNAMLTLDDLLKSVKLSRDSSNNNVDYDFDDKKEKVVKDYDDWSNSSKKDMKEHNNISRMEYQDTSNKDVEKQNELNLTQSKERNNAVDSKDQLNSNNKTERTDDGKDNELLSLRAGENEDNKRLHQGSHDNHILVEPTAVSVQNDENDSHARSDSNQLGELGNLLPKESREFKDQNQLKQNNNDFDDIRKNKTDQAEVELDNNWDSVIRFVNPLNEYSPSDENINPKESADHNVELDPILTETKKDYYDHLQITQDKEHSDDNPNDSKLYWVNVNPENMRTLLRDDNNQVEINSDNGDYRSVPIFLRERFNDGLEEHRNYVDDRHQEKTNESDDDVDDNEVNELLNNAVHNDDKYHGLIDVKESTYDKYHDKNYQANKQKPYNVYKKLESEAHLRSHSTKDAERKYGLESHEIVDHRSCKEGRKTYTLSFHFKK